MPVPFLIVDGYNLMHAAGLARPRYGPGGLERSRQRLLALLARRLDETQRRRTTIVFDAYREPGLSPRESEHDEMRILFAPEDSDADTLIEELVAGHSAPRQILVVSGDRRLQRAAKRRKGRAIDGESFLRQVRPLDPAGADPAPAEPAKTTGELSAEQTREWLEIFGDVEVEKGTDAVSDDELARRLQADVDRLLEEEDDRG